MIRRYITLYKYVRDADFMISIFYSIYVHTSIYARSQSCNLVHSCRHTSPLEREVTRAERDECWRDALYFSLDLLDIACTGFSKCVIS
jgi:hypothetical protein